MLTTQVAARWGWQPAFFVAGAPGVPMGFLIWMFVQEPATGGGMSQAKPSLPDYLSILRYRNIWLCCLEATGFMSWLPALNIFAPLHITEVCISLRLRRGFVLGASGLGSFFPGLSATFPPSDRIGRKPVLLMMAIMCAVVPLTFLVPALYVYPLLLAAIVFVANTGQDIASLVLVLVPTESVPPQFRATHGTCNSGWRNHGRHCRPRSWRAHWQKNTASR